VGGRWLLRMEDLDPPREVPGAQDAILRTLECYGFEWDGELVRQSERHAEYAAVIARLFSQGLAYACICSRKQLEGYAGIYPGFCRNACHPDHDAAIRLRVPELDYHFVDRVQGEFRQQLDRKSTRLNSSHVKISYAVFCLKKKKSRFSAFRDQQIQDQDQERLR